MKTLVQNVQENQVCLGKLVIKTHPGFRKWEIVREFLRKDRAIREKVDLSQIGNNKNSWITAKIYGLDSGLEIESSRRSPLVKIVGDNFYFGPDKESHLVLPMDELVLGRYGRRGSSQTFGLWAAKLHKSRPADLIEIPYSDHPDFGDTTAISALQLYMRISETGCLVMVNLGYNLVNLKSPGSNQVIAL
jgi:hypothetical protein